MNFVFSFPIAVLSQYFFGTIIFLLSLFMVLLILVQRGKGGGLTGALGGPGGQSAFGTKAGDLFTRITIVAAACWIFLLAFCVWWYTESGFSSALADSEVLSTGPAIVAPANSPMNEPTAPIAPSEAAPKGETAKPSAEVEVGDLPSTTDTPAKATEKSEPEPTKAPESAKEPEASTSTEKTESEAPKSEPPVPKESAAKESATSEPEPDSSKIPTPEK